MRVNVPPLRGVEWSDPEQRALYARCFPRSPIVMDILLDEGRITDDQYWQLNERWINGERFCLDYDNPRMPKPTK